MAKKKKAPNVEEAFDIRGKQIAITGSIAHGGRSNLIQLIEAVGGKVAKSVTTRIDMLVVGFGSTSKSAAEKKAESYNAAGKAAIQILDEAALHQLLAPDRETAIEWLKGGRGGVEKWNEIMQHYWLQAQVDLSGVDFRKCDLNDANLRKANLNDCDFREAKLAGVEMSKVKGARFEKAWGAVRIEEANDCNFKGADFSHTHEWQGCMIRAENCNADGANFKNGGVYGLVNCSAKRADLTKARLNPADFTGADLTAAKLPKVWASYTQASGAKFDKADLSDARLDDSTFQAASLAKANLSGAELKNCNFTAADLSGADLSNADLTGGNLQNANLTKANLTGAMLSGADLTGADLSGANLKDAGIVGASITPEQIESAKGASIEAAQGGSAGANIAKLQKLVTQSKEIRITARADLGENEHVLLTVSSHHNHWGSGVGAYETHYTSSTRGNSSRGQPGPGNSYSTCMVGLANRWSKGKLRLDKIEVAHKKSPLKKKDLHYLAVCAWCEAFGLDIPSEDDLKQQKKKRESGASDRLNQLLAGLRKSHAGVDEWNKLSDDQRKSLGRVRRVEFAGLDLHDANFRRMDLQGSDFSNSNLQGANFDNADIKKASFAGAEARGAFFGGSKASDASFAGADVSTNNMRGMSLLRAEFTGANAAGTRFHFSDLRGANFTDANLKQAVFEHAKFDEKTIFPKGFKPHKTMQWAGAGKDPRLVEKIEQIQTTASLDFAGLMQKLENNFDASRLKKSMKMLKADSFQLFSEVADDGFTGVVKSQTDAKLVYACGLDSQGEFTCCTQNLNVCGGLRGALCKHLLVLIVGLTKANELDPTAAWRWIASSKLQKPKLNRDAMSEVFLKYKGAEAGEIDWRPTETVPEDYYAF